MLKSRRNAEFDEERARRIRRNALIGFGCLFPFLFIGAYALLLLAAQPPTPHPRGWPDDAELLSMHWDETRAHRLILSIRFFRKDGRRGIVVPPRAQLVEPSGIGYRLEGRPVEGGSTPAREGETKLYFDLPETFGVHENGRVLRFVAVNSEPAPPDYFAALRWLPGMTIPPVGITQQFEPFPLLKVPPEPSS